MIFRSRFLINQVRGPAHGREQRWAAQQDCKCSESQSKNCRYDRTSPAQPCGLKKQGEEINYGGRRRHKQQQRVPQYMATQLSDQTMDESLRSFRTRWA